MVKISSIMTKDVGTVTSKTKLTEAIRRMAERSVSTLIVVERNTTHPVGVLTEVDMLHKVLRAGKDYNKLKVEDVMSSTVFSVSPYEDIHAVSKIMSDNEVQSIPVVSRKGIVGIVTHTDIAHSVHKVAEQYDHYMFRESVITWLVLISLFMLLVIYIFNSGII